MSWPEPPALRGPLARYRILSPTASVRVSPLCLGAMNFGDAGFMGECDKKTTFEILDYFYKEGGNFIDTANNYQSEESEKWLGEWMTARGVRDQIVLATKFTTAFRAGHGDDEILANSGGNNTKSLHVSVAASLKKLQTDYIDLLYVHWWDYTTSIPELMQSLNQLVLAGKVLYLGISDTPAWIVSKANEYARSHGLRPFSVYQGRWSAEHRDFERDIIPMCRAEGMGLAPWGALGGGSFKTAEQRASTDDGRKGGASSAILPGICAALEKIAKKKSTGMTSVALAYVMHKAPYVFPIVGGRKLEHLKGNIEALKLELSPEEIKEIDTANSTFDIGFPMNTFGNKAAEIWIMNWAGHFDYVEEEKPIPPFKESK